EDVEKRITLMCNSEEVNLWAKMQMSYNDIFPYGGAFFNQVWENVDGEYWLTALRALPAHSFKVAPPDSTETYSQILQGVALGAKQKTEYWQIQKADDTVPKKLKLENIFHVCDPTSTDLAGDSILLPLIPIVSMLRFTWQSLMQKVNRVGAPIIMIRVTAPQPAMPSNGNVSDTDYALDIMRGWGKDTAFQLRENMEIVKLNLEDSNVAESVIDMLENKLIDYMTPMSFVAGKEGGLIGSPDKQRSEMLLRSIRSTHSWMENQFARLLQKYLDGNGYDGYTVHLHIPTPAPDRSDVLLKQAETGAKTFALTANEIRSRLEAVNDDELAKLEEYWKTMTPVRHTNEVVPGGKEVTSNGSNTN
ncbi:MAG: hypothetical protein GWP10_05845, partial [Nitrospiraceae bacterium]|nr:hypothetical protein [Nitrospiraceae bacterium]